MGKRLGLLFFAALAAMSFLAGCRSGGGGGTPTLEVVSVTLSPDNDAGLVDVPRGGEQEFVATVTTVRRSAAAERVRWYVNDVGNHPMLHVDPANPNRAWLRPAVDEEGEYLDVTARSEVENSLYATTGVRLVAPPSVSISPRDVQVARGGTRQFTVVVTIPDVPNVVIWSLAGAEGAGTGINPATGLLTVASDEPAETLYVTATLDYDAAFYDTVTITVTDLTVTGVAIAGGDASVYRGDIREFEATVTYSDGSTSSDVTWSLAGAESADTEIDRYTGLLTVAVGEPAEAITVTARSGLDGAVYDYVTVTIATPPEDPIEEIWLVGGMAESGWNLPGDSMTKEADGTFTWSGPARAGNTFRFSLYDTSGWDDIWNGPWFAPEQNNTDVALYPEYNPMTRFNTNPVGDTATHNAWRITEDGVYAITVDPEAMTMTVERTGDIQEDPITAVWLVGDMNGWALPGISIDAQADGTFTWAGNVTAGTYFSFNLEDTTEWYGSWLAPAENATEVVLYPAGDNPMLRFDTGTDNSWRMAADGVYAITVDPEAMTMTAVRTGDIEDIPPDEITAVWLVGLEHPWSLPGRSMEAQGDGIFTLEINVGDDRHFRFSPYLATGWGGPWLAPAQNNTSVVLSPGYNPVTRTNAGNSWILADPGWHNFIVNLADPDNMSLTVERLIEVYSVAVQGPSNVVAGHTASFTATVTGRNPDDSTAPYPDQRVTWSMVGTAGTDFVAGTQIDASTGELTVGLRETADSLTVMAVSMADPAGSGTATIYVDPAPYGVNVQIVTRPERARRGVALPLAAEILVIPEGAQLDTTLSWGVAGNQSTSTVIRNISQDTLFAELFVAPGENAETLTVTVTSATDSDTLTVQLGAPAVWLIGSMTSWNPPGLPMTAHPQYAGVFTWAGDAPANSSFRFGLHGTPYWSGIWFSPRSARTPPVVTSTDITMDTPFYMERIIGESHWNWLIADAGWYEFTLDSIAETLTVHRPVAVDSVSIYSPPAEVMAGGTRAFSATLSGLNYGDPTVQVVWSVSGNSVAGTGFGTGGSSHVLSVAVGETGPLVVTATVNIAGTFAASDSTGPIQVLAADEIGQMVISFRVDDQGVHRDDVGVTGEPVISIAGNDSVTFAVSNPNPARSYEWIVSGVRFPGYTLPINSANAEDFGIGRHSVRLMVRIDGVPWSMSELLHFTVTR